MEKRLKFIDKYLTLWIGLAMILGVGIGYFFPGVKEVHNSFTFSDTNILLAIGLLVMMYPPLTKVNYQLLPKALGNKKILVISILLNWVIGPILMFILAVIFLKHEPELMAGFLLIGIARCIAMVLVWNDLAGGNREYATLLVAMNSIFQLLTYGVLAWLFIEILPPYFGIQSIQIEVPFITVVSSVGIYLGIPFAAGILSRMLLIKAKGADWFNRVYVKAISPLTLYALLFTIVFMFSLKGEHVIQLPNQVLIVAIPLFIYFMVMFLVSFFINKKLGISYEENAAVSFTATGNNFELAIAVAIAIFGIESAQAFAGVIGPLIEVPALLLLVKLSLYFKKNYAK
ncbi:MAG: ACR3 family arsenite efflux transporter [Bacteroidia bacterium]|jgi:ACR3 family arsenite transporter|nr:ACR3 family arsenite efflux transporter [Bacteroidia bacterium]